ncbi:growth hormone receptor-like isoform 1-T2 [Synchiropus picturatus]
MLPWKQPAGGALLLLPHAHVLRQQKRRLKLLHFGLAQQTEVMSRCSLQCSIMVLLLFCRCSTAAALESPVSDVLPHLTGCVSNNMETFRCRWNVGSYDSHSDPADLRLFYLNIKSPHTARTNWTECPHYSTDQPHECFFNENHTSIWTHYRVQLRSGDQTVLYDETLFHVDDIVQPEPPIALNWTLLNMSLTSNYFDIIVSWKPPPSCDVATGWITLQYEVQYRNINSGLWQAGALAKSTHQSVFGLQTNVDHEIRVRCKMLGAKEFGDFSDSIVVHVPTQVSKFPVLALLVVGSFCLIAVLMLIIISQQEKLMFLLLPPVPGPKIHGINSHLLKKGNLRELNSIMHAPAYQGLELENDPWVEFIDVDLEDSCANLYADCIVDSSLGFRDNDSGRVSGCDLDAHSGRNHLAALNSVLSEDVATSMALEQREQTSEVGTSPGDGERELLYTQVKEVKASGKVLLMPEEEPEKDTISHDSKQATSLEGGQSQDPPPLYTSVESIQGQTSVLLAASPSPTPLSMNSKNILLPDCYLTPELLGSITP